MTKVLASLSVLATAWLVGSWMLMLTVGIVHAEWIPQLPTIGYRLALLLTTISLVRVVLGSMLGGLGKVIGGDKR